MDKLEEDGNGLLFFFKQFFKVRKSLNAKETKSSKKRRHKIN